MLMMIKILLIYRDIVNDYSNMLMIILMKRVFAKNNSTLRKSIIIMMHGK